MSTFQGANQIVQNAVRRMQKAGAEQLNTQVNDWMSQTKTIMNTLLSYQAIQQSTLQTYAEASRGAWQSQGMYTNNLSDKNKTVQDMLYKTNIERAYQLINHIGETVRGTEIQYSLILSGVEGESSRIEWSGLNMSQFLELTNVATGSGRMRLKSADTIMSMLKEKNANNITMSKWSDQKEKAYQHFVDVVQKRGTWTDLKEGQMLEAFSKYYRRKNKDDNMILDAMKDTLSAPEAFWQGGDDQIGKGSDKRVIQYKANDASVTDVNTVVAKLDKIYSALAAMKGEIYNSAQYAPNQANVGSASASLDTAIEKFVVQFLNNDVLKALKI